jgi:hypothetical protein
VKARPRSVERKVAQYLSRVFSDIGKSPVERIPVLGRTGPDITCNEVGLVIDVKSRLQVPKSSLPAQGHIIRFTNDLIVFRLMDIQNLPSLAEGRPVDAPASVMEWYSHMDKWTQEHKPGGITALVLHRPRMPIGNSGVVINYSDRSLLCHRLQLP